MPLSRRRRANRKLVANINITSLLDITFVLLISFMVVAPALKHGIELELPTVREAPTMKNERPIAVQVKPGVGIPVIFVDGQEANLDTLGAMIEAKQRPGTRRAVTLEGDKRVDWQEMSRVIGELRKSGVEDLGILTAPLSES
jgi:biopolymer transport protein TolR